MYHDEDSNLEYIECPNCRFVLMEDEKFRGNEGEELEDNAYHEEESILFTECPDCGNVIKIDLNIETSKTCIYNVSNPSEEEEYNYRIKKEKEKEIPGQLYMFDMYKD